MYVLDLADTGARWQVSTGGGEEPNWSSDGRTLFYRNDTQLMKVPVETKGRFEAGAPTVVMEGVYNMRSDTGVSYQVMPKGDRFLMIRPAVSAQDSSVVRVVLNFFNDLRRKSETAE